MNEEHKAQDTSSDYDESCYPREASSEEEDHSITVKVPQKIDQPSPPEDPAIANTSSKNIIESTEGIQASMICGICSDFLLDPVSLECGHTFCQLCVAHMWKNKTLNCPMCRKPWGQAGRPMPSVNVSFRDLLEHNFPAQIQIKKDAMTHDDKELIHSFHEAHNFTRTASGRLHQRRGQLRIQGGAQQIYCVLGVILLLGVLMTMFLVSMGVWLLNGLSASYIHKPVSQWSNNDVVEWISELGDSVQNECLEIFIKEKIDGHHLLRLTDASLQDIGIKSQYVRDSLLLSISRLDETSIAEPRTFSEFKAVNIRQLVLVLLTYKSFPRLTFSYMYTLQYYNMFLPVIQSQMQDDPDNVVQEAPHAGGRETDNSEGLIPEPGHVLIEPSSKQLVAITLEILLLPHLVITMFALSYFYYNKFVFSLVLVHCIHSTVKDVRTLRKRLRNEVVRDRSNIKFLFNYSLKACITYIVLALLASAVFHILPLVLLDCLFYLLLFHSLFIILYDYVLRPVFPHMLRIVLRLFNRRNNN